MVWDGWTDEEAERMISEGVPRDCFKLTDVTRFLLSECECSDCSQPDGPPEGFGSQYLGAEHWGSKRYK